MKRFVEDRSGTVAIEYAILGGCIFFAIVAAVTGVGTRLSAVFATIVASFP